MQKRGAMLLHRSSFSLNCLFFCIVCFFQCLHLFAGVTVCVGFPVLHLVVLAAEYRIHLAVWIDLGQGPAGGVALWQGQTVLNQICFCFCKCCITGIHIVLDSICFFHQSGKFLVAIQQRFGIFVFLNLVNLGVAVGVVSVVVAVCFLNQVVLWVTEVCAPAKANGNRMQAWYINLLCTAGNIGLDIQCDIVIAQAVGEYLFEDVRACLLYTSDAADD